MDVALVTISIDRDSGEVIKREIKETKTIDEDEFYKPLVEVLGDAFLEQYKNKREAM